MADTRYYEGRGIRVTYERDRCIHAAECVRGLPAVFDPGRRPWVDAAAAPADEVAEVVRRCPTGALRYETADGVRAEQPPAENHLVVTPDGPIHASGDLQLLDPDHRPIRRETRAALCRCGASRNKPFCDGRHADIGFADPGHLGEARVKEPSADSDACLGIRLRADGPLVLSGRFRMTGADGQVLEAESGALCRCGASGNKPFCDGTHRHVGFEADDPTGGGKSA